MITFLPYPDFARSAKCLDWKRLGKQRVESYQIIMALTVPGSSWRFHPAVTMWDGHVSQLVQYMDAIVEEWVRRGYVNNMVVPHMLDHGDEAPRWLGDPRLHDSHKSNLLRKDPAWYGRMGWRVKPDMPYFWPKGEVT